MRKVDLKAFTYVLVLSETHLYALLESTEIMLNQANSNYFDNSMGVTIEIFGFNHFISLSCLSV